MRVCALAREEARHPDLRSDTVGIEHLLIGLLREEDGTAAQWLRKQKLTPVRVRNALVDAAAAAMLKYADGAELRIWGGRADVEQLLDLAQRHARPIDDLIWEAIRRTLVRRTARRCGYAGDDVACADDGAWSWERRQVSDGSIATQPVPESAMGALHMEGRMLASEKRGASYFLGLISVCITISSGI